MNRREIIKLVVLESDPGKNGELTTYVQSFCLSEIYPHFDFQIRSYRDMIDCLCELEYDTDIVVLNGSGTESVHTASHFTAREVAGKCSRCHVIRVTRGDYEDRPVVEMFPGKQGPRFPGLRARDEWEVLFTRAS
jgi:hypothetical protein